MKVVPSFYVYGYTKYDIHSFAIDKGRIMGYNVSITLSRVAEELVL